MKKSLLIVAITFVVLVGGFFLVRFITQGGLVRKPVALSVVTPVETPLTVFINNQHVGQTPYYTETLKAGEVAVKLTNGSASYETKLRLTPSTLSVINWDLGIGNSNFSTGEIVWLEKSSSGTMLSVVSEPAGAGVHVDGNEIGTTPYLGGIAEGEHSVEIYKEGFELRRLRLKAQKDYKLNLYGRLFLSPYPKGGSAMEPLAEVTFKNLSSDNPLLYSDPSNWAKALGYWVKTRKTDGEDQFVYFLDYDGNLYDPAGVKLSEVKEKPQGAVAYLGRVQDGGMSEAAKNKMKELTGLVPNETPPEKPTTPVTPSTPSTAPPTTTPPTTTPPGTTGGTWVEVIETGTGWLRVRSEPVIDGTNANEITKVNVGEKFQLLEEQSGWMKIKLTDGKVGWASATFLKKISASVGQ
ncbi:MAG: PEGA domain-containing protein [bacterium]|nr:PEGA domain-containing protein [bacterium]